MVKRMTVDKLPDWLADDPDLITLLNAKSRTWLITGVAGFIGSNLLETLLLAGQNVRGLDNFATGHQRNLDEVESKVGPANWSRFRLIEGDIRNLSDCTDAVVDIDHVLHQAALGSVPRSLADPVATNEVNITGFLNILDEARKAAVKSMVYAASSSTYGDEPNLPKVEDRIGNPLSPYAVTKYANELYANVYSRSYGFKTRGLRYFNVFGPRQDPDGAYAAVIPKWAAAMISGTDIVINGDGKTSRDFCYVANAVQANIKASLAPEPEQSEVYNIAVGESTTLNDLFATVRNELEKSQIHYRNEPQYGEFRPGDVRHSLADIAKARTDIGYSPSHTIGEGIEEALPWYIDFFRKNS